MEIKILQVGDKVKIAEDLSNKYTDVADGMIQYAGRVATITKLCAKYDPINFKLDIDNGRYFWYPDAMTLAK